MNNIWVWVQFLATAVTLALFSYWITDTNQEATVSFAISLAGAALMRAIIADYKHEAKP